MAATTQPVAIIRSVGGFIFDVTIQETHEIEYEITTNPLETGVSVGDHKYRLPYKLTIQGMVSDTPLHATAGTNGVDQFTSTASTRSKAAFDAILSLGESTDFLTVQTGLKVYQNMQVKKFTTSQDKDSSRALLFTLDLLEVDVVTTQIVNLPPRRTGTTNRQASAKIPNGKQQPIQPPDQKGSILSNIFDAIRGNPTTTSVSQ